MSQLDEAAAEFVRALEDLRRDHAHVSCNLHSLDEDQMRAFLRAAVVRNLEVDAEDASFGGDARWIKLGRKTGKRDEHKKEIVENILTLFIGQRGSVWRKQVAAELEAARA